MKFLVSYRPGQPNWERTVWKFQDFSATQILRKINPNGEIHFHGKNQQCENFICKKEPKIREINL